MALEITTKSLCNGAVGEPYSQELHATGGLSPLRWSVMPELPLGMALDVANGAVHGTPAAACPKTDYTFTVTDSSTPPASTDVVVSLEVGSQSMSKSHTSWLASFLLVIAILTGLGIYSLWSSRPPNQPVSKLHCAPDSAPQVTGTYPLTVDVASSAGILFQGCSFASDPPVKLKVNGADRYPIFADSSNIRVALNANDVALPGPLIITLTKGTEELSHDPISVVLPRFYWKTFGPTPFEISLEMQLLLLVLCTGAFGSSVYALKSLADFRGEGELCESWSLYYFIQPIEGAGIAFLLYVAIRGGFLAGTVGDVRSVNQFGMCAIAGLGGAFSDTAFLKLREVFQTLFRPQDDRGGKVARLRIATTSLPDGYQGQTYSQTLQALDGTGALTWSVNPELPQGLTLDANTGRISGIPLAPSKKIDYKFTVTDRNSPPTSSSAVLSLQVN